MSDTSQSPTEQVRIGSVIASIWENETERGTRHSVQLQKTYRNGDSWAYTTRFGRDDLLPLAKAADQAHTRILQMQQAQRGGR